MKNLTTGHPLKLIFFFALPLMFGNLLQQLYIMVDTMIVGRFVGVDALASIGGADWINWAILGLLMGFTQGFSIRVSNCLGANDEKGMEKSIAMSYLSCFVIAILVILLFTNNYRTFIKTIKYTKSYNSRIYYLFKNHVWWSFNCNLL